MIDRTHPCRSGGNAKILKPAPGIHGLTESIQISMDGCGRWWDHVVVERLWRRLKYEVSLHLRDCARRPSGGCRAA